VLMRWDEPDGRGRLRSESVESQIRKSGRCPSCACGPAGWISDPAGRPPHWARPEPSRLQIVDPLAVTGHTAETFQKVVQHRLRFVLPSMATPVGPFSLFRKEDPLL